MWRIYYADGSIYEEAQGPATGEQARGILAILQSDPEVGWYLVNGSDYYIWRDGRWWGCDIAGLFDYLLDSGLVLLGRMVDNATYQRIFSEALLDKDMERKNSFLPKRMKEWRPDGSS